MFEESLPKEMAPHMCYAIYYTQLIYIESRTDVYYLRFSKPISNKI